MATDITVGTVTFKGDSPFAMLIPQLQDLLTKVAESDKVLAGLAGSHAARKAEALAKLTALDVAARADASDAFDSVPVGPVEALQWAQQVFDAAKSALDDAKAAVSEAVDAALRADKSAASTERESTLAARTVLVEQVCAMATLVRGAGKVTPTDLGLTAPKGSGGSSAPRAAKVGQGVFSYRRAGDAEWTVPCDAQQSLSATAYRVFAKAPVGDLREALAVANGGDKVDETQPFEHTVTLRDVTATVKFDVVSSGDEAPAEG